VTDNGAIMMEAEMSADIVGEFLGIPGHGRNITFRILHVFEFDDSLITREQVWLDTGSMMAQLIVSEGANP
jgi:predicted ester cyclase